MIIGTRGSDLALTQARTVAELLLSRLGIVAPVQVIHTQGDRVTDRPLRELEGAGYFTKEIEEALLRREIDIAVHSFKDMPSRMPAGLALAAVSVREDVADLLLIRASAYQADAAALPLSSGAIIGTSAVRRETQLRALRPDLHIRDLRGNVPTRIAKLQSGQYDAIILAAAGANRLHCDLSMYQVIRLDVRKFVPAPGQGALAIQVREDEPRFDAIRSALHDSTTETATIIERNVQARFGGGCGLPLGVHAWREDQIWHSVGFWGGDKTTPTWMEVQGNDPIALSDQLYHALSGERI
ncbi:MAG: hydroxymethylbilane synthase [Calditrichota bacterium]